MMCKESDIISLLHGLGFSSNLKGFRYLFDMISHILNERVVTFKMSEMYIYLSLKYDSSCTSITKCIKESIEKSWNKGNIDLIEKIFEYSIGFDNDYPSNSLFVNTIVDYLRTYS